MWAAATLAPSFSALEADVAAQLEPVRGIERSQLRADWHRLESRYSPPRASRGALGLCAPSLRRSGRGVQLQTLETLWIETVLTFHPVLPIRAAVVASVGAALALFALASLSPAPPRASVAQMPPVRASIAASVAYSRDSLAVLSRADSLNR